MPVIQHLAPKSFRRRLSRFALLACLAISASGLAATSASASITGWELEPPLNISEAAGSYQGLEAVSCSPAGLCMAVGDYVNGGTGGPLAEVWDGKEWSLTPTSTEAELNDLVCVTSLISTECGVIGSRFGNAWGQKWTPGGGWTTMTTPTPPGASSSEFNGAGCAPIEGKLECIGVGTQTVSGSEATLAMRWEVATQKFVILSTPTGGEDTVLNDVGCNAVGSCFAVGYYDESGETHPLAMRWNGSTWSVESVPDPEAGGPNTYLNDVSCTGSGAAARCVAVGYSEGAGPKVAVGMYWNGEGWSEIAPAEPAGLEGDYTLNSIACLSTSECYAVGEYSIGESETETLVEEWNGGSWSVSSSPNPGGALRSELRSITCLAASGDCLTVGQSEGATRTDTLALYGE